jgi:hypothetical protein
MDHAPLADTGQMSAKHSDTLTTEKTEADRLSQLSDPKTGDCGAMRVMVSFLLVTCALPSPHTLRLRYGIPITTYCVLPRTRIDIRKGDLGVPRILPIEAVGPNLLRIL